MEIFISWSGPKSHAVALALHNWLPKIVNAFKPWLSSTDLDKGTRWSVDVAGRLQHAKAGIICLTPSNLHADWLLFEAGALSKQVENTFVCPLLVELDPSDVKGPLAQFQFTRTTKNDVLHLLKTLNRGVGESALSDSHIDEAFGMWWPKLEGELKALPDEKENSSNRPHRSERELLEEILSLVRNQNRGIQSSPAKKTDVYLGKLITEMIRYADPSVDVAQIAPGPLGYQIHATGAGGQKYYFTVPATASMNTIKEILFATTGGTADLPDES